MKRIALRREAALEAERGGALIIALALVLALTILVTATQWQVVQDLKVSKTERDYERALQMAESGANAYLNRLTFGAAPAPDPNDPNDPLRLVPPLYEYPGGVAPSLQQFRQGVLNGTYLTTRYPPGSEQGYLVGTVGGTGSIVHIISYGWANGVVRRVVMHARKPSGAGDFAIFGITSVDMDNKLYLTGNIGTNGDVTLKNDSFITDGLLMLFGPTATGSYTSGSSVTVERQPDPLTWPTVDEIILETFPNSGSTAPGGWAYLATHNDNASATVNGTPGIQNNRIFLSNSGTVILRGKAGGAHYYLTDVEFNNDVTVRFENGLGPITVWIGPSGASGGWLSKGKANMVTTSSDPANKCQIYCGTQGGMTFNNNTTAVSLYAYNVVNGVPIGSVTCWNQLTLPGQNVIANTVLMHDDSTVNYPSQPGAGAQGSTYELTAWAEFE